MGNRTEPRKLIHQYNAARMTGSFNLNPVVGRSENALDNPSDKCDPTKDGTHCMGICVAGAPASKVKQPCGELSGIMCPGGMVCVDDTQTTVIRLRPESTVSTCV
ncbi:hypothetical protein SAMN05216308_101663 [Nitrosospira sp. Nsp13]|nr:hypothetical protein SAMN05216308_101663 [Nitrosospira sp. Nsp13]